MALQGAYARNKARRNRNVNAHIDQSLFGDKSNKNSRGGPRSRTGPRGEAVVTSDYLKSMRETEVPGAKNSVLVSAHELRRMHESSVILTASERVRMKEEQAARQNEKAKKAKARKERMLAMEAEKNRRAPNLTESEALEAEKNAQLLSNAKEVLDEGLDDVKHMNQMILYAKCATIRDMQIQEKDRIRQQRTEQEERLDMEMEVNRIKQIKLQDAREKKAAQERKIGAQEVIYQIQEREAARLREQELREQEAAAMLKRIEEMNIQEEQRKLRKVEEGKAMMASVLRANQEQAKAKQIIKQQERAEEDRIAEYIAERDAKLAAREEEERMIKHNKEMETARMRAQQQKAIDMRGAEDELRAKRYTESYDRAWRAKQLEEAKKKEAAFRDMAMARETQRQDKAVRMAEQAYEERVEYERGLRYLQDQALADEEKAKFIKIQADEHRNELLNQIAIHDQEKALARQQFLEEGKNITVQMEIDRRRLLRIKNKKMAELSAAGVPDKYQADLAKKKVLQMGIH